MEFDPSGIFVVAAIGAVLFAFAGTRTGRLWWVWALWGVLTGLTVGTFSVGLAHSIALPYATPEVAGKYIVGAIVAVAIMALLAGAIIGRAKLRER